MNATEQRTHRTVTQSLESRIEALETLVAHMSQNCDWLKARSDEACDRLDGIDKRLEILNQGRLRTAELNLSFLARLRWLFLGR